MLTVISSNCSYASPLQTWIQEYGYQLLFMPLGVEDFFLNLGGGEGGEVTWFFFRGKGGESVVATEYKEGPQKIDCLLMASQGRGGGDGVIWMLQSSVN